MPTTRHLSIFGRVQGVGYRESMRAEAQRLGCAGWVRNRRDGSVEAMVYGQEDAVAGLVAWAGRGPPSARVTDVRIEQPSEEERPPERFEVRPTA